jgi:predicted CXXCH cytochrome family protein
MTATAASYLLAMALAAAVGSGPDPMARPLFLVQDGCTEAGCHDALVKTKFVHDPVSGEMCDSCHQEKEPDSHEFELTAEEGELCGVCHEGFEGKIVHAPVEMGDCTSCHDPHGSDTEHLLAAESVAGICTECHVDPAEERGFVHGPVAAGACVACHDPHASDFAALAPADGAKLCAMCHSDMEERLAERKFKHAPVEDDCASCHDPHGADNKMMLAEPSPGVCLECHVDVAENIDAAPVKHAPVSRDEDCVACHEPHAANFEHLLDRETMKLCFRCHAGEEATKAGLLDFEKLLTENREHHGPILDEDCAACHQVHGGEHTSLLVASYPSGFYASYSEEAYGLCFECHDASAMEEEKTESATDFRNGDQNLHYVHVNRQVKGRTCRACHEVHASKQPKHIRETVRFGAWELPVGFRKLDTGGVCSPGCHRAYRYDRDDFVDNIP